MLSNHHFLINGAGPVGLSISMLLQQKGYSVSIYEKRVDPRQKTERGKSINLALSERGFRTLSLLGLEETIKKDFAIAMKGRMIHDEKGQTHLQPYSSDGKSIYSVSRGALNNLLLDEAEKRGLGIFFEHKCLGYDRSKDIIQFENTFVSTKGTTILACDGAFSPLRQTMKQQSYFQHIETTLDYAYKEFTIPAGPNGTWLMAKDALHIWPRKSFMLIALPNTDGSFTCTLFLQLASKNTLVPSFKDLSTPDSACTFFREYFPDAFRLMPDFTQDFEHNPISTLYMETCSPWNLDDKLLLLGDAAHAIVPFYGQGLNAGLEDVRLFSEEIQKTSDLTQSLSNFQHKRKPDADAIGELALQNFIEMRDLVTDDQFLTKRKLESALKKIYQDKWTTQYESVTFSSTPYSKAQQLGKDNNQKLNLILENELLTSHLLNDEVTEQDMYLLSMIVL